MDPFELDVFVVSSSPSGLRAPRITWSGTIQYTPAGYIVTHIADGQENVVTTLPIDTPAPIIRAILLDLARR